MRAVEYCCLSIKKEIIWKYSAVHIHVKLLLSAETPETAN